eukprot:SAG31_NODE_4024_length_3655_cov_1.557087_1_plen_231_part_00
MGWSSRRVAGYTPGFDFSGEVISAPRGSGFREGDEVFGIAVDPTDIAKGHLHGSFAEVVAAPVLQVAHKPASLTHVQAAALPLVGTTCIQAFQQHSLGSGQRLLVIGASGGVGHVAVQIAARSFGAHVTAVCSGRNRDFVTECGASVVLDYTSETDIFDQIKGECGRHGPWDVVLDCVNSADSRDQVQSYRNRMMYMQPPALARGGGADSHNYVVLGGATGEWALSALKR